MNETQSKENSWIHESNQKKKAFYFLPKNDGIFTANSVTVLNDMVDYLIATCCAKIKMKCLLIFHSFVLWMMWLDHFWCHSIWNDDASELHDSNGIKLATSSS